MEENRVALPYFNNVKAVVTSVVISVICVSIFSWPNGATFGYALLETVSCVIITTIVNFIIVYHHMKKIREKGAMPTQVPVNRFMQKLPKNPFALGCACIIIFGIVTVTINALVLWAFGFQEMSFWPWMAYKLVYSSILSIKIAEFCVFRYVQPDWANTEVETIDPSHEEPITPVKDPLPKISVFKALFGAVTMNMALNIIIGSLAGGVVLAPDQSIIIYPTTIDSIYITGFIFGFITGFLTTNAYVNSINKIILSPEGGFAGFVDELPVKKQYSWMPKRKSSLICLICLCTMIFSAIALTALMALFQVSVMNFYQFTNFITAYAAVVGMPLKYILKQRCLQPDYVRRVLNKANKKSNLAAGAGEHTENSN